MSKISADLGRNVEEIVDYVEELIRDGHINAQLERSNTPVSGAVLRFFLDPTQGPLAKVEKQQQQALLEQTQRMNRLIEQVKSADNRLNLTKEFVDHLKAQERKAANKGEEDVMDLDFEDDENIMA